MERLQLRTVRFLKRNGPKSIQNPWILIYFNGFCMTFVVWGRVLGVSGACRALKHVSRLEGQDAATAKERNSLLEVTLGWLLRGGLDLRHTCFRMLSRESSPIWLI